MAAVASNHVPEGMKNMEEQFSEPNTSRFTAVNVNGRGPSSSSVNQSRIPHSRGDLNEAVSTAGANEEQKSRPDMSGPRPAPPSPRVRLSPTESQPSARSHGQQMNDVLMNGPVEALHQQPSPGSSGSPPVRKRSYPEAFGEQNGHPYPREPNHPNPEGLHQNGHGEYDPRHSDPRARSQGPSSHLTPSHEYDDRRRPLGSEYDPHAQPSQPYYTQPPVHHDDPEARLAEALQRENGHPSASMAREGFTSPEEDDLRRAQYGEYSGSRASLSGSAADAERKRRKRVFSNRTKTGCMTCRKRKKKCDELHPECNNCLRGGFVCEGYTVRNTWQKPSPAKTPVPLQSKTGYPPSGHHQPQQYAEVNPEYGVVGSSGLPPPQQHHGSEVKPIIVDEDRRSLTHSQIPSPPSDPRGPTAWTRPSRSYSNQGPTPPSQRYPEHDRPPTTHDLSSEGADPNTLYPNPPNHPTDPRRSPQAPPSTSSSAPAVAQAALQTPILTQRPAPHYRVELTERERMLRGEYFLPYTPALMEDRERCAAAVWRFNNSTNPTNGNSPEERLRFFKAILALRPSPEPLPATAEGRDLDPAYLPVGSVGPGVVVEAPFHCDYGYNITIGSNVVIGPDCRITDTCAVTIGDNVVFSPGVKLVCVTYAIDPRERKKGKGRALGRNIVIENDCWIGSNVTILPGVRVGRSSTVGAGSLICKDVPPYTVVAGNPQKVVRGIYDGN